MNKCLINPFITEFNKFSILYQYLYPDTTADDLRNLRNSSVSYHLTLITAVTKTQTGLITASLDLHLGCQGDPG